MRSVITLVSGILLTARSATCSYAQGQPSADAQPQSGGAKAAAKHKTCGSHAMPRSNAAQASAGAPAATAAARAQAGSRAKAKRLGRRDPSSRWSAGRRPRATRPKIFRRVRAGLQVSTLRIDGIVHSPNGHDRAWSAIRSNALTFCAKGISCTTAGGQELRWTEFRSMSRARMRSESQWNGK